MPTKAQPLIEYLQQLQRKGETHIHLDENARNVLREFYLLAKGIKTQDKPAAQTTSETPITTTQQILAQGNTPQEKINSLTVQVKNHPLSSNIKTLRDKLVFSGGNPNADIMFISGAPGYYEETKGLPFAGPAGQKLDGILKAMGLSREQIYITHLVKYRPSMPNQTTANRKPTHDEIEVFAPFIQEEIKAINPKVIVALGSVVAEHILDTSEPTDNLRGKFHHTSFANAPIRITYNPSYLLQNEAHSDKRKIWEDMLSIMEKLQMPISDKQQNFFLPKK